MIRLFLGIAGCFAVAAVLLPEISKPASLAMVAAVVFAITIRICNLIDNRKEVAGDNDN